MAKWNTAQRRKRVAFSGDVGHFLELLAKSAARTTSYRLLINSFASVLNDYLVWLFSTDAIALHPYEPVGCFKDDSLRAMPVLLQWYSVDKENLANSLAAIIHSCATQAYENGFWYFGVEYQNQCWSGLNSAMTYNRYGSSNSCLWNYGVGDAWTIFVYRFVEG